MQQATQENQDANAEDVNTEAAAEVSTEEVVEAVEASAAPAAAEATETPNPKKKGMRWYIIQAHSGFEKKVKAAIESEIVTQGLQEQFEAIEVPTEEVVEVRRGKKVQSEKKFFPGYVLAKMTITDASWQLVKSTDKVTGFLGGKGMRPQPITEGEAQAIFKQVEEGVAAPRNLIQYDIGEEVKVVDGPFDSFVGVVEDIDEEREKLKVSVSIFGRATPVELEYSQVQKA